MLPIRLRELKVLDLEPIVTSGFIRARSLSHIAVQPPGSICRVVLREPSEDVIDLLDAFLQDAHGNRVSGDA